MSTETPNDPGEPPRSAPIEWLTVISVDRGQLWFQDRDSTAVASIPGGWLLRFRHYEGEGSLMSTQAITFVPDPEHRWTPKETPPHWEGLGGCVNAAFVDQSARLAVPGGWVYKNHFFIRARALSLSLVYVPATGFAFDGTAEVPGREGPLNGDPESRVS